jgi:predicted negative regulator of RcsB-dependent stress response
LDRLTRKELKTDKFAQEFGHSVEYMAEHRKQLTRYAIIAVAIAAVALAIYGFQRYREGERQDALKAALRVQDAIIGPAAPEGMLSFNTQQEKDAAVAKAMTDVATHYAGSREAAVADFYLGSMAADKGNLAEAEKRFKAVADGGDKNYSSLAKLSLATIYGSEGKRAEGEQLLRSVVNNPTVFVSKEQATIALAKYLAPYNPQEARKLLEPLRGDARGAISRVALSTLSAIPQK